MYNWGTRGSSPTKCFPQLKMLQSPKHRAFIYLNQSAPSQIAPRGGATHRFQLRHLILNLPSEEPLLLANNNIT